MCYSAFKTEVAKNQVACPQDKNQEHLREQTSRKGNWTETFVTKIDTTPLASQGFVLRTLLTARNQESRNMLAPDSSPVTVSYHLYSVSSGRCRVTIPGRHLEEGDGLCIRCRFIRAMGKIQRTHARVPLAHYIKRLTKKLTGAKSLPPVSFTR